MIGLAIQFIVYFGTNIGYYTIRTPGYSHVFSFGLIAAILYFLTLFHLKPVRWKLILIVLLFSLIVSVRPINLLFLGIIFFINIESGKALAEKILETSLNQKLVLFLIFGLIALLPIFCYNFYASDSFFAKPYPGENFSNLFNPQWEIVLFSASNGLFIYTPIFLIFLWSTLAWMNDDLWKGATTFLLFFAITLVYSSWWSPSLGCSFSNRAFTEFIPVFAFPFGLLIEKLRIKLQYGSILLLFLFACLLCSYSQAIYQFWWYCFYGANDFDYRKLIDDFIGYYNK